MSLFTSLLSKTELLGWKRSSWPHRRVINEVRELPVENHQILQYWSSRDSLTGTANRRQLELVLEHQWRCAIIAPSELSLLMIDLDHFHEYVDAVGQQAGDNCLKQVACSLSSTLIQPGALLGRYDQSRFMVILPRTGIDAAAAIAKSLSATVEGWKIPHPAMRTYVTISVGVVSDMPRPHSKPGPLIHEVEQALHRCHLPNSIPR